jgi:hypothetical protein
MTEPAVAAPLAIVNGEVLNVELTRREVERIIESYTLCMVGTDTEPYVAACADDVLAEVLGWAVRYKEAVSE